MHSYGMPVYVGLHFLPSDTILRIAFYIPSEMHRSAEKCILVGNIAR